MSGRILPSQIRKICHKHHSKKEVKIFIETGTWFGKQSFFAKEAKVFDKIYGIELDKHWCEVTKQKNPEGIIIHGDTRVELPKLLDMYPTQPLFIYLDAHWTRKAAEGSLTNPPTPKTEFPLWDELELIKKRNINDIVAIDDVPMFGQTTKKGKFTPESIDWENVTKHNLLDFFGKRVLDKHTYRDGFVIWLNQQE